MRISDWSSDVCSSDLPKPARAAAPAPASPPSSRRPTRRRGSTFSSLCSPLFKESIAVFRRVLLTQTYNAGVIRQSLRIDRDGALRIDGMVPCRGFPATRSEEHTSEIQSLMRISYAVFCLKTKQYNIYTN